MTATDATVMTMSLPDRNLPQWPVIAAALAGLAGVAIATWVIAGPTKGVLVLVGAGLGISLYHAAFGFTSAWREFIADRRGAGIRAQMLLLTVICAVSLPLIATGNTGQWVFPVSVSMAIGAFLFGVGMQLGGGCGSGTLYTVGGGSSRMVVTLIFFIIGSVIATAHLPWWRDLPSMGAYSGIRHLGLWGALALNLGLFAAIAAISYALEKRRHGEVTPITGEGRLLSGPWPLIWGALALAFFAIATFLIAGRPWGITSAFALWGAKAADAVGIGVREWAYWENQTGRIDRSVFHDTTSVMDFGLMLGALGAAGLAGRFAPTLMIGAGPLLAAVIGGLLLGYGARLAYGCNIGALLGGISSASLHGWAWALFAIPGNMLGIRLRPVFGL